MGLVDYGSDSDEEASPSRSAAPIVPQPPPTTSNKLNLPLPKASTSSLSLPPPKHDTAAPSSASSSTAPTSRAVPPPKKAKGPVRILLDLPPPSNSGAVKAESLREEDSQPAHKKIKLSSGGTAGNLSGLAGLLPKPKNENSFATSERTLGAAGSASAVGTSSSSTNSSNNLSAPTSNTSFLPQTLGKSKPKPSAGTSNSVTAALQSAAPPATDFFGLGSVAEAPNPSPSLAPIPKPSLSISSAPSLAPPPADTTATAEDPYPGFTQLPSGQWVAKDQATYDLWVQSMENSAENSVPKGFGEQDIAQSEGGMIDITEQQRAREAWATKPEIASASQAANEAAKAKLKIPQQKAGGDRARRKGQLSALLADAVENRQELEDRIAAGRANRKTAGNRYGF